MTEGTAGVASARSLAVQGALATVPPTVYDAQGASAVVQALSRGGGVLMGLSPAFDAQCGYCGKPSNLALRVETLSSYQARQWESGLFVCPACGGVSMLAWDASTREVLAHWPRATAQLLEGLPVGLREEHQETWDCFHAGLFRASTLMARTVLQHAVRELQAKHDTFKAELDDLVTKAVILPNLREAADQVRLLGNDIAHPPEEVLIVERDEAEELLWYMDSFLTATFVLPARLQRRAAARSQPEGSAQ
jgi:Domain of unknown function (DUF4145)